jgi:uncharacterized membrane protein YhaH (DUF805 family)
MIYWLIVILNYIFCSLLFYQIFKDTPLFGKDIPLIGKIIFLILWLPLDIVFIISFIVRKIKDRKKE